MKVFSLFIVLLLFVACNEVAPSGTEKELILAVETKAVMDVFRDKKDDKTKALAIMSFINSLKPLCKSVANVKWKEIAESELKRMDKEVGVFIGGMSDYQIKFRGEEKATLSEADRAEIKRICKEIEKRSLN